MPLTAMRMQSVAFRLRREPTEVRHAREQARKALFEWGLGEHAELAEVIVSELVTNAICHGEGPVGARISYDGGQLRVEVHDDGPGRPAWRLVTAENECGRGLALLDGLIGLYDGRRGVADDDAGDGKTVYVTIWLAGGQ